MVKAQSESYLIRSFPKRRWNNEKAAAGVDLSPTLKRGSLVGSSALYNASFPLRSPSGDMNEPLVMPPSPRPTNPIALVDEMAPKKSSRNP
jgi:hypothetical protein